MENTYSLSRQTKEAIKSDTHRFDFFGMYLMANNLAAHRP